MSASSGEVVQPLPIGSRVQLQGLSSTELNGAEGRVIGPTDPATGRTPVVIDLPAAAKAAHPHGVKVAASKLILLPPGPAIVMGVSINGYEVVEVALTPQQAASCAAASPAGSDWRRCPVPTLLGVPLALLRLPTADPQLNEQIATYLMIDPVSGFAPPLERGPHAGSDKWGPALVARMDGLALSKKQLFELHDYNCHLLDMYADEWGSGTPQQQSKQRRAALTPEAFAAYSAQRQRRPVQAERDDDDDEEDEDEDDYAGWQAAKAGFYAEANELLG